MTPVIYRDYMRDAGMRPGDLVHVMIEHLTGADPDGDLTTTEFLGTVSEVHDTIVDRLLRRSHFYLNGDIRVTQKQPKDGDGRAVVSIWPLDAALPAGAFREPGGVPTDPYDVQVGHWVEVYRENLSGVRIINWGRVLAVDVGKHFTLADNATIVYDDGALRAPCPVLEVNVFPAYSNADA